MQNQRPHPQTRRQDVWRIKSWSQLNQPSPPLERLRVVVPGRAQSCRAEGFLRQQIKRLENCVQRDDNSLTMKAILFILTSFLITWPMTCYSEDMDNAIRKFQQSLIVREITGSNVAMVYQDNKRLYHEAVQSKKEEETNPTKNISSKIWKFNCSME